MSNVIRSFVRQALLESDIHEARPRTPSWLDEARPRTPSDSTGAGGSSSSGSSSGGSRSRTSGSSSGGGGALAPPDPMASYADACIQFLRDNSVGIGIAADSMIEDVTGFYSPDEIMSIYVIARDIDKQFNEFGPMKRNWAVNLLGMSLSSISGVSLANYVPGLIKQAEDLLVAAQKSVTKENLLHRSNPLIREGSIAGSIGNILRRNLVSIVAEGSVDTTFKAVVKQEAKLAARTAANNVDELNLILAGGSVDDLVGSTLAQVVRRDLLTTFRRTELSSLADEGATWASAAKDHLAKLGKKDPSIGDLLDEKRPLPSHIETARATLKTKASKIQTLQDDADILDPLRAERAALTAEVKAKTGKTGGMAGSVGGALGSVAQDALGKIITGLVGLAGAGLGLWATYANIADYVSDTEVSQTLLQAVYQLRDQSVYNQDQKVYVLDLLLMQAHVDSAAYNTIRAKIAKVCAEYWSAIVMEDPDCVEFQNTLARGPGGS